MPKLTAITWASVAQVSSRLRPGGGWAGSTRLLCGLQLLCALAMPTAWASTSADSASLLVSEDGSQVTDRATKLVWSRCVEGMQWNGQNCTGTARLVTHAEALSLARARAKEEGLSWRIPRVKELQHLVGEARRLASGADTLFPGRPSEWLWSASTSIATGTVNQYDYKNIERGITEQNASRLAFLHGWVVNMATGEARGDMPKRTRLPIRLVRQED